VMKGLPLTYSKDMQEDKEGTFDALQSLSLCIAATAGMVRDLTPDLKKMKAAAGSGYSTATDLADWLVRSLKMPFRDAHHVTGRIVGLATQKKIGLEKLTLLEMQGVEPRITDAIFDVLGVDKSVKSRLSYGGTAPSNVKTQAKRWLKALNKERPAAKA
jgi:argininosuccinate lyase